MDLGLNGRRAIVAAASQGLGYAIAHRLAGEGCRVEICSRSETAIGAAAERITTETGSDVRGSVVDVADSAAVRSWVDDAADRFGGLDIVVPNAGGPPASPFSETAESDWDAAYRLTLRSAMAFAAASHPHLKATRGTILYLTSSSVREPIPQIALSGIFRLAVAGLAKTLASEWGTDGIRVNQLIPGRISTERVAHLDGRIAEATGTSVEDVRRRSEGSIPLGRYGEPSDFAAAAAFLVSPAASYITGATLQVDGGAIRAI
ncbi:MAG: SDR family oxidoreductase [Acidimicrobiia bacterium]|nr:SDR family oxidoreductase [Acidimicrobiia bacterium]